MLYKIYFVLFVNKNISLSSYHQPFLLQKSIFTSIKLLIYASSFTGFWPILYKVVFDPDIYKPFAVNIYCGKSKPENVDGYLR